MEKIKKNRFRLVTIVAVSKDFIIGDGNQMLWHLPNDLKRLKSMTMGAPLIMGRKTFESIGKPLPGRANIVLTRSKTNYFDGAIVVNSFDEAITKAGEWIDQKKNNSEETIQQKIFLFGGAEIYKLGIDFCDVIQMTKVKINIIEGTKFLNLNISLFLFSTKFLNFKISFFLFSFFFPLKLE